MMNSMKAWLAVVAVCLMLASCGGTTGDTQTQLRLLNASNDIASANLYTDSDLRASGVAPNTLSGYAGFDPKDYTVKVTTGIGTTVASVSQDFDKDTKYTAVAWGRGNAVTLTLLPEPNSDNDGIASGSGRLRVFNTAANEAGLLDVYLTDANTELDNVTPSFTSNGATVTAYSDLTAGTYRLRVTAAGNTADVRLDLPAFTIGSQQASTLVLEPSASGVLVNAVVLVNQGGLTLALNPSARVRAVASVTAAGPVTLKVGDATLFAARASPSIGNYTLVPAAAGVAVTGATGADGAITATGSGPQTLSAGGDYTVLVAGTVAAPTLTFIPDDNRLPTDATKAKIRLINGYSPPSDLTLTVDSTNIGTDVSGPGSNAYTSIASESAATVAVTSSTGQVWPATTSTVTTNIKAAGVYSVFILDGATGVTGVFRSER